MNEQLIAMLDEIQANLARIQAKPRRSDLVIGGNRLPRPPKPAWDPKADKDPEAPVPKAPTKPAKPAPPAGFDLED